MSQQAQLRNCKHYHPQCIAGGLGPLEDIRGVSELSEDARREVEQFADSDQASRSQYLAAMRRRVVANDRDLGEAAELGWEAAGASGNLPLGGKSLQKCGLRANAS